MQEIVDNVHRSPAARGPATGQVFYVDGQRNDTGAVEDALDHLGLEMTHFQDTRRCLDSLRMRPCHLLISNVSRPTVEGAELLGGARGVVPPVPVVVLVDPGDIRAAVHVMKRGAVDCLERPPQKQRLVGAIDPLIRESVETQRLLESPLTGAEEQVLHLLLAGKTNSQTARALHRSPRTVEVHRAHIMRKLRVSSMVDLVRVAAALGLLGT